VKYPTPIVVLLCGIACLVSLGGCGQSTGPSPQGDLGQSAIGPPSATADQYIPTPQSDTPLVTAEGKPQPPPPIVPTPERIAFGGMGGPDPRNPIRQIYTMYTNGTDVRLAATGGLPAYGPTWSPDGTQIAYSGYDGVSKWIAAVPSNGGSATPQIIATADYLWVDPDSHIEWASWGPEMADGSSRIAFNDWHTIKFCEMGTEPEPVTRVTFHEFYSPTWSPDGTKLMMTGQRLPLIYDEYGNPQQPRMSDMDIWLLAEPFESLTFTDGSTLPPTGPGFESNNDEEHPLQLVHDPGGNWPWQGIDWCRAADANGNYPVAYSDYNDIWVFTVDALGQPQTSPTKVTNTPNIREQQPKWSPLGTHLVFQSMDTSVRKPTWRIKTLELGTGKLTDLAAGGGPAWSPRVF